MDLEVRPPQSVPLRAMLVGGGSIAWLVTAAKAREMGAGPGTMGMGFWAFIAMWSAMMAAMMLPALRPVVGTARGNRSGLAFAAGFLVPWALYGAIAFPAFVLAQRLVGASPTTAHRLGVGILALAGLYELSPWKFRAVRHCRMAIHPHDVGASLRSAASTGVREGFTCVGCCWALMAVLVATGAMNLVAMALLAAVIFAEKVLPAPRIALAVAGAGLLLAAAFAAGHASVLPGLAPERGAMKMGTMQSPMPHASSAPMSENGGM